MTTTRQKRGAENVAERITDAVKQMADVITGHDHVHPDRNDCGGVGGCALMRAEHDTEQDVIGMLAHAARQGFRLKVEVVS